MDRAEALKRAGPVFAPLVGRHVECPHLEVARINGKKLEPACDAYGEPIELHAEDEMRDLVGRITAPGRYRVIARAPGGDDIITYADYMLEPQGPPRRRPQPRVHSPPAPHVIAPEHGYIAHLHETINNQRDQLRELASRADRDVRYERERADERVRLMQDKCETATRQAHDAEVKVAAFSARLEARTQRVAELEEQLAEMKAEVDAVRDLAAELKLKAQESEFSPLDALLQMDQALDVIGKTAERFTDRKK